MKSLRRLQSKEEEDSASETGDGLIPMEMELTRHVRSDSEDEDSYSGEVNKIDIWFPKMTKVSFITVTFIVTVVNFST